MPVVYRLDDRDCFVTVNDRWRAFAEANGAPELAGEGIFGQPVWRYVAGIDVAQLYREVFRNVRERRSQVVFPFRCDSREIRRDMLMKVLPRENSHLEIHCLTRSIVRMPEMLDEPSPQITELARQLLCICSWCKSVQIAASWVPIEAAIKQLDLFGTSHSPQLTHGICPKCNAEMSRQLV